MRYLKWLTHPGVAPALVRLLLAVLTALAVSPEPAAAAAALVVAPLSFSSANREARHPIGTR